MKDIQDVNRLKLVLVEKKKTSKWLSEELGVSQSTVSKWCTKAANTANTVFNIEGALIGCLLGLESTKKAKSSGIRRKRSKRW